MPWPRQATGLSSSARTCCASQIQDAMLEYKVKVQLLFVIQYYLEDEFIMLHNGL